MTTIEEMFGPPVHTYTRKQALADGYQVDVTEVAKEAGIWFKMFVTRSVFDGYVAVPPGVEGQDEKGRLWDIVWMTRYAIRRCAPGSVTIRVELFVRNDNRKPKLVQLLAQCGPVDMDDPTPAITVMMPDED